ncbi:hypothetical protein HELRODRAFT_66421, partial [Helobdella robusta]|uniref:Galactosylgalactosylxylosylprotein 3-beta-glucuronosyltransferase n=1 Tax=Helobdella robusta TaxID=6412 RepID=T1FYK9_HELRO
DNKNLPTIYIITPTYSRLVQKAELTRLTYTLKLVQCIHWIVVEDSTIKTQLVKRLLAKSNLKYTHLNVLTPPEYKLGISEKRWRKPRGVLQRNEGLRWLRSNKKLILSGSEGGVVYFADDDNTYDVQLFDEMRSTKKVSVWPVGFVGKLRYESPIVGDGRVVDWFTYSKSNRTFATDMAGFAVNADLMINSKVEFSVKSSRGMQENDFLVKLKITLNDLEPKADLCTKVLVWHTQTMEPNVKNEELLMKFGKSGSNLNIEI